ncbi:MAG: hypothetical protein ACI4M9_02605, partial [Succinivibrio sp.]
GFISSDKTSYMVAIDKLLLGHWTAADCGLKDDDLHVIADKLESIGGIEKLLSGDPASYNSFVDSLSKELAEKNSSLQKV